MTATPAPPMISGSPPVNASRGGTWRVTRDGTRGRLGGGVLPVVVVGPDGFGGFDAPVVVSSVVTVGVVVVVVTTGVVAGLVGVVVV
jgi:hypothetical protein